MREAPPEWALDGPFVKVYLSDMIIRSVSPCRWGHPPGRTKQGVCRICARLARKIAEDRAYARAWNLPLPPTLAERFAAGDHPVFAPGRFFREHPDQRGKALALVTDGVGVMAVLLRPSDTPASTVARLQRTSTRTVAWLGSFYTDVSGRLAFERKFAAARIGETDWYDLRTVIPWLMEIAGETPPATAPGVVR